MSKKISPLIRELLDHMYRKHGIKKSVILEYLLQHGLVVSNKLTEQGMLLILAARENKI